MKKKIFAIFAILCLMACNYGASAQEMADTLPIETDAKQTIVDSIADSYEDWNEISMSGRLSSAMLPVTAMVKVHMVKDELAVITVSAMLVGEAFRIEIDREQALIVNKMKNTYTTMETAALEPVCPGGLSAIQNLLLGRISILGKGELSKEDVDDVEIYNAGGNTWMVLPVQDLAEAPYVYFYTVDKVSFLLNRLAVLAQSGNGKVNCFYKWTADNMTIDVEAAFGNQNGLGATIVLNNPDTVLRPIDRFKPTSSYKATDLQGVLRF